MFFLNSGTKLGSFWSQLNRFSENSLLLERNFLGGPSIFLISFLPFAFASASLPPTEWNSSSKKTIQSHIENENFNLKRDVFDFTRRLETLSSTVIRKGSSIYLVREKEEFRKTTRLDLSAEKEIVRLRGLSHEARRDLLRAHTGDVLTINGRWSESQTPTFYVSKVVKVGLRRLLGVWRTRDWKLCEFENFETITFYDSILPARSNHQKVNLNKAPEHKIETLKARYWLAPAAGTKWSLFLIDGENVRVGEVDIKGGHLVLTLIDPETSRPSRPIKLTRYRQ